MRRHIALALQDLPRWRVLAPFSSELPPAMQARSSTSTFGLNGLFHGIFAGESWTLSQSFYYGSVAQNPSHRVYLIDGWPIDQHDDLENLGSKAAPGPPQPANLGEPSSYTPASSASLEGDRRSLARHPPAGGHRGTEALRSPPHRCRPRRYPKRRRISATRTNRLAAQCPTRRPRSECGHENRSRWPRQRTSPIELEVDVTAGRPRRGARRRQDHPPHGVLLSPQMTSRPRCWQKHDATGCPRTMLRGWGVYPGAVVERHHA